MLLKILTTREFDSWVLSIKSLSVRGQINIRIDRARRGNFGDVAPVGEGVSEMRLHCGPGYRIYLARQGDGVYIILTGGTKNTQQKDHARAKALWAEIKRSAKHG